MFEDRAITCNDCSSEFSFTAGEQEFYAQRGFTEPPKRCPSCRAARKASRQQSGYSSGGGYAGEGYGGNGGESGYGSARAYAADYRERGPREMFEATCADCGNTASVPFRPSGVKPVYCSSCFQGRR